MNLQQQGQLTFNPQQQQQQQQSQQQQQQHEQSANIHFFNIKKRVAQCNNLLIIS